MFYILYIIDLFVNSFLYIFFCIIIICIILVYFQRIVAFWYNVHFERNYIYLFFKYGLHNFCINLLKNKNYPFIDHLNEYLTWY